MGLQHSWKESKKKKKKEKKSQPKPTPETKNYACKMNCALSMSTGRVQPCVHPDCLVQGLDFKMWHVFFFFRLPSACCLWFFFSSWDRVSDSLSPFQWGIKPTYLPSALAPPQTTVRTLQTIWVGVLEIVSVAMILEKERRMLVDEEKRLNRVWQRELFV